MEEWRDTAWKIDGRVWGVGVRETRLQAQMRWQSKASEQLKKKYTLLMVILHQSEHLAANTDPN